MGDVEMTREEQEAWQARFELVIVKVQDAIAECGGAVEFDPPDAEHYAKAKTRVVKSGFHINASRVSKSPVEGGSALTITHHLQVPSHRGHKIPLADLRAALIRRGLRVGGQRAADVYF